MPIALARDFSAVAAIGSQDVAYKSRQIHADFFQLEFSNPRVEVAPGHPGLESLPW